MVLNGVEVSEGTLYRKTLVMEPVTFLLEGDIANHFTTVLPSNALWTTNISVFADPSSSDERRTVSWRPGPDLHQCF